MWKGLMRRFSYDDGDASEPEAARGQRGGRKRCSRQQLQRHQHSNHSHGPQQQASDGISGVFTPAGQRSIPFRPPPLEPVVLHWPCDDAESILTQPMAEEIRVLVPERLRIHENWRLVYSLEAHGASLSTLYQNCKHFQDCNVGFVLVVQDQQGGTFGAYLSEYPHPARSYFGNGECFLWRASTLTPLPPPPSADTTHLTRCTTLAPSSVAKGGSEVRESIRFKAFPYRAVNDCFMNCEAGFLSVGSGGGYYGLWLDDALNMGHSSRCQTFDNEPLSDVGQKFNVVGVELWVLGA